MFTGITRTRELDINPEDLKRWQKGEDLIQNIFPDLSPDDREFLMTGSTPEEWDEYTKEEE